MQAHSGSTPQDTAPEAILHPASRRLFGYWNRLRAGRKTPLRSDIDPRIAEPGTTWGTGRTIIGADVDAPGIQTDQIQAAVYMDAQERLVLLSEAENTAENAIDATDLRETFGADAA